MIEWISQPWHWAVTGAVLALNMFLLLWMGRRFGISSSLETLCTIGGAGRVANYFRTNWRDRAWLLLFVVGSILGGWLATEVLPAEQPPRISGATIERLADLRVEPPFATDSDSKLAPTSLFSGESLFTLRGFILMVVGGFLIGFGTRYAKGCTSGHAITGLSNLHLSSLIATIGFFVGGLIAAWLLIPFIVNL